MLSGLRVHSDIGQSAALTLPAVAGTHFGTTDVLQKIHNMTRASQARPSPLVP